MFSAILKADRELYILINSGLASPFFDKLMMVLSSTITWAVAALILLIFFTRRGRGPGLKASVYCAGARGSGSRTSSPAGSRTRSFVRCGGCTRKTSFVY